ncbi:LysM peptidoglycan-binding domain-containing protein [Virgibacillus sp. C22-A2]|uniref:LysM peptidoglycan-binding domain-containing protein n=1 Tax=Virgibacillus tibetensis TaxID=3042313 RepID=A0ABU6KE08_9BACI|nr:LysM peptidoglycan-binding domain-containing protein [Virgibacillus sp. C22-A2]
MASKKIIMSVTASAAIASAIFVADETEAASYKVQSGDSLWSIAQKFNTSVSQLRTINSISGDIIFPNQVIETDKGQTQSTTTTQSNNQTTTSTTYTVKGGDTLSGIASKHNISLANLMKWNNLNTTLIYPGNVFTVSASGSSSSTGSSSSSSSSSSSNTSSSNQQVGSTSVYVVKSGDSLSRIASQQGVTVANLKSWNNLRSDLILIGQKLNIGGTASTSSSSSSSSASEKPTASVSYNVNKLISTAKSVNGTRYVWGGSTPGGFDCSGFIHYAYKQAGMNISRLSSEGYYNRSFYVSKPQVGDLVFFSGTYKAGISHMGIYLGNNEFIHASSSGVQITNLNNSYWKKHFEGFKRFY